MVHMHLGEMLQEFFIMNLNQAIDTKGVEHPGHLTRGTKE